MNATETLLSVPTTTEGSFPGIRELRAAELEAAIRRPVSPDASKDEIRVGSSLCVDHLCGCKK